MNLSLFKSMFFKTIRLSSSYMTNNDVERVFMKYYQHILNDIKDLEEERIDEENVDSKKSN